MHNAGDQEDAEGCNFRPEAPRERTEGQIVRELIEGGVPTAAPEFSQRSGEERRAHDGLRVDSSALPRRREQIENSEVEKQEQTDHADPAREQRTKAQKTAGGNPG